MKQTLLEVWSQKIINTANNYPFYVNVPQLIEDIGDQYPEFKKLKPLVKGALVGKCLTGIGLIKNSRCHGGWVYRRPGIVGPHN